MQIDGTGPLRALSQQLDSITESQPPSVRARREAAAPQRRTHSDGLLLLRCLGGQKVIKHTQWVSVFQRYKQPPPSSSFSTTSSSPAEWHCTSGAARASYPRCSRHIWFAWMCVRGREKTKRTAVKRGSAEPLFDLKFQLSHRLEIIPVQGNPAPLVTPSELQISRLQKFFHSQDLQIFVLYILSIRLEKPCNIPSAAADWCLYKSSMQSSSGTAGQLRSGKTS